MGTGPKAQEGYDLRLTEDDEGFTIEAGSASGLKVLEQLPCSVASEDRIQQDEEQIAACAASQTRTIPHASLPHGLYDAHDHARWDEVAARCLACTNCTMVCPTCFCHGVEETPSLDHQQSEHARVWDSCFTSDHGYIHGKNFRPTTKDRYRMWLTHKLGSWIDQFGMSGCVGCGRCITWCPVGIDLTEEVHALCQPPQ
jgi:formate hydrogenlyase subunit 6/NADH:ubiquinone oxidoreductase subunit I